MSLHPTEITPFVERPFIEPSQWLDTLDPGHALAIEGSGGLSLVIDTIHRRAVEGVLVVDVEATSSPEGWAHPEIYVVVPSTIREAWLALDLALRSGAFGLVVSLDLPRDPRFSPRYGSRIRSALRTSASRLVMVGERAAFSVPRRVRVASRSIDWTRGPLGDAPHSRSFAVDVGGGPVVTIHTDCVHPAADTPRARASPSR